MVDRAALGGSHQPRAGIVGNARFGSLLESGDQSLLCEVFGETDIAHHAREAGNQLGRFDSPDRVDGAVCVGNRHSYRSHHLHLDGASRSGACLLRCLLLEFRVPGHHRLLNIFGEVGQFQHRANLEDFVLGAGATFRPLDRFFL